MKIGNARVQGQLLADTWQRIASYTLTAVDAYTKLQICGDQIADATGKTVTANGNAAVTSAQYKFPELGKSIVCDGTGDYLSLADSDDWYLNGDWTVDGWFRFNSVDPYSAIVGQYSDDNNYWAIAMESGTHKLRAGFIGNALDKGSFNMTNSWSPNVGQWYHLAWVRSGTTGYIFIDGVSQGVTQYVTLTDPINIGGNLRLGSMTIGGTEYPFNGWMSQVRVSKGVARWTSNFTPPAFTDYSGANTSIKISGLDGNTHEEYIVRCRFVNGYNGGCNFYARPNNDSGANYGWQFMYGAGSSLGASSGTTDTFLNRLGACTALNQLSMSELFLHAKSGQVRSGYITSVECVSGTTIVLTAEWAVSWNNTSDNITSLVIYATQTNGLGVGTIIELFAKKTKV